MTEPLNGIDRARIMKQVMQMRDDLAGKLSEADATIAALRDVADTAGNAITTSSNDRAALHEQVNGLAAVMPAFGTAATPALALLGTTRDVTVVLNRPMPADTYTAVPVMASALLGKATAVVKTTSKTTVTLTVSSLIAAVAASSVLVIAWP